MQCAASKVKKRFILKHSADCLSVIGKSTKRVGFSGINV